MEFIIDRFEGDVAIAEDENKNLLEIKKLLLPDEAKEGDVVVFCADSYRIDKEATKKRRAKTLALLKKLGL